MARNMKAIIFLALIVVFSHAETISLEKFINEQPPEEASEQPPEQSSDVPQKKIQIELPPNCKALDDEGKCSHCDEFYKLEGDSCVLIPTPNPDVDLEDENSQDIPEGFIPFRRKQLWGKFDL